MSRTRAGRGERRRATVAFFAIAAVFAGLAYQLYAIQVRAHSDHRREKRAQSESRLLERHARGTIRSSDDVILSLSVPAASVWADPARMDSVDVADLARALSVRTDEIRKRLEWRPRNGRPVRFVWVKRKLSSEQESRVRELLARRDAPFGVRIEFVRRYPLGVLASHLLGLVDIDERGGEGLERIMDAPLNGGTTSHRVQVDARRRILGAPEIAPSSAVVTLTIIARLQSVVEEEVRAMARDHKPRWVSVVVLQPRTGEILALANWPSFDANHPGSAPPDHRRNRAVVDPSPPGSVIKSLFVAGALDDGRVSLETVFDCENGAWRYEGRLLRDHHPYGKLSLAQVLVKSSNIGAAKMGVFHLGREGLLRWVDRFGLGRKTGVDLPAEYGNGARPGLRWTSYSLTSLPIGQEILATPLQMAVAIAAVANGGWIMRPYVVRSVERSDGTLISARGPEKRRRILREGTCARMRDVMAQVVSPEGTGRLAVVEGVRWGGKTGTSQIRNRRGVVTAYVGSFVGFAPAEEPRMCVAVVAEVGRGGEYYGGKIAAPAAGNIVRRGLALVP